MQDTNEFFKRLEEQGVSISESDKERVLSRLNTILTYEPRIGLFGKTGVGKSSLCNALFGKDLFKIDDIVSCTRNVQEEVLKMGKGIKIVDVPGVGENSARDEEYGKLYAELLPELDVVLWLLKADDKAYATDELFYSTLVKPHIAEGKPFFFVVNQVDKIEPFREWDEDNHRPGDRQARNIEEKIKAVSTSFGCPISKIVGVSANEKYNIVRLVDEIILALPRDKKVTMFRAVSEENRSKIAYEDVKKSLADSFGDFIEEVTGSSTAGNIARGIGKVVEFIAKHFPLPFPRPRWPLF